MDHIKNVLVTGGAGFIGSSFIRYLFSPEAGFFGRLVNIDKLTYAGNPQNLADIETVYGTGDGNGRYVFVRGDICDADLVNRTFAEYDIDTVFHFAAESHVDRSIHGPGEFIRTNITGTFTLLEAARARWIGSGGPAEGVLFHHVSTDEVYGPLGPERCFSESSPYNPRSPYSASKAASDHLVKSYHHTYGLPVTLSNCSNNFGPYQFPEKLIPLMILNMLDEKPLPVYGDGKHIRDWLHVYDHDRAVWTVAQKGRRGESYNIGGENEWENIELVRLLCEKVAEAVGRDPGYYKKLITFVPDRPGHDRRYAVDCAKIKNELGWSQNFSFEEGLEQAVRWYLENRDWAQSVRTGEYRKWIERNYGARA